MLFDQFTSFSIHSQFLHIRCPCTIKKKTFMVKYCTWFLYSSEIDSFNKISKTKWAHRVPCVSVAFRLYCKVPHITLYSFSGIGCMGSIPDNEIMTILYSQITGKQGSIGYATGFFVVCLKIKIQV